MSLYFSRGSETEELSREELRDGLFSALDALGERRRVIAVPPDFTRRHSGAGPLARDVWKYYGSRLEAILPALGTHSAMTESQIACMFGDIPRDLFAVHDFRRDPVTLGEVPAAFICEQSEGKLNYPVPIQLNRILCSGRFDLILSIGQVVPHEVIGMANFNKNVLIGTGGAEAIDKTHFLGAVYGMERIMGRADTPVRRVLNYAAESFGASLPIVYILTVMGRNESGATVTRGLFIGDDRECFERAADLSRKVNITRLDRPIAKAVVWLDPGEFKSMWIGNKAIYRTRMALADDANLIILAPGVREFGEDSAIDQLIRRYGYQGTAATLGAVHKNPDLAANLSAAAHLIHGSSEGRFAVTYCTAHLTRQEIESAGFRHQDLAGAMERWNPFTLGDGYNEVDGEQVFFISNPALGLWVAPGRI